MKSRLFKKVIAGVATLAMAAQFGFVIPASAEGEYYTQNFEAETAKGTDNNRTGDKQEDTLTLADDTKWASKYGAGFMSIAKDSNSDINMYYKYEVGSSSGGRSALCVFGNEAKQQDDNKRTVFEMDFFMSASAGGGQIVLADEGVYGTNKTNTEFSGNYAIALYQVNADKVAVATLDGKNSPEELTGYKNGTWAHLKAVMNFKEDTVVMEITSLDGKTTFLEENKFAMGGDNNAANTLVTYGPRNASAKCGVDNIVFRPYAEGDIKGTYYMATITADGNTVTRTADKTTGLIDGVTDPTKTGYLFQGWAKDGDTDPENLMTTKQVLETKLTDDVTYTAVFEEDPAYIEPMVALEFSSFPENGIPVMSESADEFASNQIQVKLVGELGNDLLAEDNRDERVKAPKVEWKFKGFRTIVSDGGRSTDENSENGYCDTYAQVVYDENDPTKADFQQKLHGFNFYGEVEVKVTYGEPEEGVTGTTARTLTITKPMAILPNKTETTGVFLPKPGYVADFSPYENTMIGYKATREPANKDNDDIVTGGWTSSYGSNSTNQLSIASDDEGATKYLRLETTAVSGASSFATNKLSSAPDGQVIISQDVRFGSANSEILLKSLAPTNWSAGAITLTLKLTSSGFTLNGGAAFAPTASTGVWYHVVLSADVTSKLCYAMIYDMEDNLIGQSDTVSFSDTASVTPVYLMYRNPDNIVANLDFNNVKMYTPEIEGDLTTTISNSTLLIPSSELDEGINYSKGTVSVKKSDAKENDKATLVHAIYNDKALVSIKSYDLTFNADGVATQALTAGKGSKLMVWNSLEEMEPIVGLPVNIEDDNDASIATLTVDAKSTEGYSMIGNAEWTVVDEGTKEESAFVKIAADKDNSHRATLTVAEGAQSGTYNVNVTLGGKTKTIPVTVTGTQESVKFITATSSIAIPLEEGKSETYDYNAIAVDKNNNDLNKEITYAMYDKNNENVLANTDAISFDAETKKLTVTSEAKSTVVYIRATSTNSDGDTISRSQKVTIHGLSFDFGTADGVVEGYTAVTPDTQYSDATGYGIASGTAKLGGEASIDNADSDYLEGAFKFQAKVAPGKVYAVTVKGASTTFTAENVVAGLTGAASSGLAKDGDAYLIAVTDDILDLTFASGSKVSSIEIEKQPDKNPGSKPTMFTVGDSTLSNNGSWAYVISHESFPTLANIVEFQCNGQGSQNLDSFYNGGQLMSRVLVNIKPGDYVTIGNMGTNGEGVNFEQAFNAYVDACIAMGAKVIINSYSPHGAVGGYANTYNRETHIFDTYRKDNYDVIARRIYGERSTVDGAKYDPNVVGFMDIGVMADDAFNAFVADYAGTTMKFAVGDQGTKTAYADENAAADAIIACFGDHNHYGDGGKGFDRLASNLMVRGYEAVGDRKGAIGIVNRLIEIVSADLAKDAE